MPSRYPGSDTFFGVTHLLFTNVYSSVYILYLHVIVSFNRFFYFQFVGGFIYTESVGVVLFAKTGALFGNNRFY